MIHARRRAFSAPSRATSARSFLGRVCSGLLLLTLFACGGDGGTQPPVDPPVVNFVPPAGSITMAADQVLSFRVTDAQGADLVAFFTLDGDSVSTGASYDLVPPRLGTLQVEARVEIDGEMVVATWTVQVDDSEILPTPEVFELTGMPGPEPGSVDLQWERPPPSLIAVPIIAYEVAIHTQPFGDEEFEDHVVLTQNDVSAVVRQRATLQALGERVLHTVRVRSVDAVDRRSVSRSVLTESTGQYALTGTVYAFPRVPGPSRVSAGVVVEVGSLRGSSGFDGRFSITRIPDLVPRSLVLKEQTGATFYEIDTGPLPMENRDFELLLLPRGIVQLEGVSELTYPGGVIERLDFLKLMRETELNGAVSGFPTWQEYPVKVYVHPHFQDARGEVIQGRPGELVDYAAAFALAIEKWNDAAGAELLELVPIEVPLDPAQYANTNGVFYDTSLTGSTSILGRTEYVRPSTGMLYRDVPELEVVKLRSVFNFQDVADWVVTHELGHVLGLGHSPSRNHIMLATSSVTDQVRTPDPEEALLARLLRDLSLYGRDVRVDWYTIPE